MVCLDPLLSNEGLEGADPWIDDGSTRSSNTDAAYGLVPIPVSFGSIDGCTFAAWRVNCQCVSSARAYPYILLLNGQGLYRS